MGGVKRVIIQNAVPLHVVRPAALVGILEPSSLLIEEHRNMLFLLS